jgi:hypothetical protein
MLPQYAYDQPVPVLVKERVSAEVSITKGSDWMGFIAR